MSVQDRLRRERRLCTGAPTPRGLVPKRIARVGVLLIAVFLLGLFAAVRFSAHAATTDTVELRLWPAGQGRIEVSQNGGAVPVTHNGESLPFCDFVTILDSSECRVQVTAGQPVTLTAIAEPSLTDAQKAGLKGLPDFPASGVSFARWSRAGCEAATTCTFTPDTTDNDDWITALFTPLQLEVGINGHGTVSIQGGGSFPCNDNTQQGNPDLGFGDTTCHGTFPPDATLVLVANPAAAGDSITWGSGCDPEDGKPASARCTVTMSNIRTFASVGFAGANPPDFPFQITPRIRVKTTGSGQGKVSGNGIDCGTQCSADVGYQTKVTLKAQAGQGSSFIRWVGVCSNDPTCSFAAGSATFIEARFDTQASPTTTATPSTTQTTTTTRTPTTTTTATTGRTTTTTPPHTGALTSRLAGVKVDRKGRHRTVIATIVLNRAAHVSMRLQKHGRTIVARSLNAPVRRSALRLPVPATAPAGLYLLTLKFATGAIQRTITTSVRIGR